MDHRLPVLMGHRLLLREPTRADGARLFACASDPEVTRFLAFDPPRSLVDTLEFIDRVEAWRRQDREYAFLVASLATDEPLGIIGLRHMDLRLGTAEIGTWLRQGAWGTGMNAEAKALLLDYAFGPLGLHRVEARIAVGHQRSRRAFEKLGAVAEGTLRESFRKGDQICDQVLYAILAPEWRARGGAAAVPGHEAARGSTTNG
jgi:ribosomal-protein-alanine N-acetyltransferase